MASEDGIAGEVQRGWDLHRLSNEIDVADVVLVQAYDKHPSVATVFQQAFLDQSVQCFAQRAAADAEVARQHDLSHLGAGRKRPVENAITNLRCDDL